MDAPAGELSTGNARKLWIILCTLGVGVAIKFAIRSVRIILCTLGVDSLIVLDEPFSGLDAHGADTLRAEIDAWSTVSWVLLIAHGEASEPNVDDIFLGVTPSKEH
ncbi:MAG: hypothetical protein B5766_07155 [Candidatus Lumbricidophila eiseniae]|uniref:ABC transporter domain-containing protein n=1 Tax=Candidatus Lumbricidiphila eiseniae TaxID=1969409 RepID=A0A2A6FRC2_9MICO|nr:MAG: hypothetical protein B5766_07155 [Candidatus Lumbricidophila eiseniae]